LADPGAALIRVTVEPFIVTVTFSPAFNDDNATFLDPSITDAEAGTLIVFLAPKRFCDGLTVNEVRVAEITVPVICEIFAADDDFIVDFIAGFAVGFAAGLETGVFGAA
jgi:hypothetical protein